MNHLKFIAVICTLSIFTVLASCVSTPVQKPKDPTIQELIMAGRYPEAKELFKTKTDINAADADGNTALHLAAKVNEADLVSFLIIKGADTELKNNSGDTALHVAIKNSSLDAAKVLAIVHGDIFAKDASGTTALELALAKGDQWYEAIITQQSGELRDTEGESIVHYFVKTRNEKAIDYCIKLQLPLSVRDNNGMTPVATAFQSADDPAAVRIAAALIKAGAEPVRGDFSYFEDAVRTRNTMLRFNDGQTPLHLATISGHSGIVDYLLNQRTTARIQDVLQAQDISGATPLHEAVRYGRTDIARTLLSNGAQVDALDSLGKTPLLLIIPSAAQHDMYSLLLEYKANINQKDMYGDTVLHVATMGGAKVDILRMLVENGASVNERNKQGVTPLSVAIEHNLADHVAFYAEAGADIHAEDQDGNTPLTRALSSDITMLQTLVTTKNVLSHDSAGNTPLHIAIMKDVPLSYIKYLVDTNADVNARNRNGDSVLYMTVQKNRKAAGTLLLEHGANIFATNTQNYSPLRLALTTGGSVQDWLITSQTLNAADGSGNTPLHYAAEWKLDSAVTALIQKGAKVNAVNANGENAIFSAVKSDSVSTINLLASSGVIVDARNTLARDHLGNTVLHACVRWNAVNSAKTLIGLGSDVNAQNMSGKSPLSDACRSGKKDMAQLLISHGADVNATDATGKTVLIDAIQGENEAMVTLLLANGANPQIQEMFGRNAYHEAALTGNSAIITLIRNAGGNPLSRDSYGETPFSLVLKSNPDSIRAVLGSSTTIVDSDGNTPVHIGVERRISADQLRQLIDMGYPVSQRNGKGKTALMEAIENNDKNLAIVLLEKGADPFVAATNGESALSTALKSAGTAAGQTILDGIARYNGTRTDMQGDGILHYAARIADAATVSHLLSLGLDRSVKNISGETPADMARRWQRPDIAELLK
jgi:uncharacterized protein